jgi:CBS domain-containing protein
MIDVKGVHWVDPDMSVEELAALMRDDNIAAIPVGEDDQLIGMVTDRDIVCRCIAERYDPATVTARDVMHRVVSSRR